jgi:tyrosine-protein kinase Etk/Wzc
MYCGVNLRSFQMNNVIQQVQSSTDQESSIDLAKYMGFLIDNRFVIVSIALIITLLGAGYAFIAKPIYEANILIQVEESSGSKNIPRDLSSAFDLKTRVASEMEILRSRFVVARAVDNAQLYIKVQPKYFFGIGAWIARRNNRLSEPGLFGHGGYVWGAEKAEVSIFNVPEALEGTVFVLTADGNNEFRLSQEDHGIEIKGRLGETVNARTMRGEIELRIDQLLANPGAQFLLTRTARLDAVEKLQRELSISEKGKQSGIVGVSLEGPDPKLASLILNEIGREYIRQNVDRKSQEAANSLAFLNKKLPDLKQELESSETKYNELRNSRKTIDLSEENKSILQQSVSTQTKMIELRQKREELLARFQNEHPAVEAINQQIRELSRELATVDTKIKSVPSLEQDVFRLARDVKVNTDLYTSLLGTAQQLRLMEASEAGNARLLDTAAKPVKPVRPKRMVVISFAAMIGIFLGIMVAFVKKTLSGSIHDPQEIQQALGLTLSATIPHSESQKRLYAQIQSKKKKISVLPHDAPSDRAIESLRSFRTSLQFEMLSAKNNIIVITGPTPAVGKSFVSANFAAVLAAIGKKVLLIDGDMRTGYLHRYFGLERKNGLSEFIKAETNLDKAIHKSVVENVDFISTGRLPAKPAELLAHENFGKLLDMASTRYDFVLVDTAPVLAFSDALIVGTHAGAIFNVVRSGVSTVFEIEEAVRRVNQAGRTVTGTIFNDLKSHSTRYGYGAKYGKYKYSETIG